MGLKSKDIIDNLIRKTDFLKAGETILPGGRISRGFYGTEVEKKIISNQNIPGSPPAWSVFKKLYNKIKSKFPISGVPETYCF